MDDEFGMLLDEIPHAIYVPLFHQHHQNSHVHGHAQSGIHTHTIHGMYDDDSHPISLPPFHHQPQHHQNSHAHLVHAQSGIHTHTIHGMYDDDSHPISLPPIHHQPQHHQNSHAHLVRAQNGIHTQTIHGMYDDNPHHHHHEQQHHHGHAQSGSHTQTIRAMYDDDPLSHGYVCVSPVSGVSLRSEGSSSSWLSAGLSIDDEGSQSEDIKFQIPPKKTHYPNGYLFSQESELPNPPIEKNIDHRIMDELGLSEKLHKMHIRHEEERFERSALFGSQFDDRYSVGANRGSVVRTSPYEDFRNGLSNDCIGLQSSVVPNSAMLDEERRLLMLGLHNQSHMGNLSGLYNSSYQSNERFSYPGRYIDSMNFPWKQAKEHPSVESLNSLQHFAEASFGGHCYHRGIQVPNMVRSVNKPSISDSSGDFGGVISLSSPHMMRPNPSLGVGNLVNYRLPVFNDGMRVSPPQSWAPQSPSSLRTAQNFDVSRCEDSFIIQGKSLKYVINNGCNLSKDCKRGSYNDIGREHSYVKDSQLDSQSHSIGVPAENSMYFPSLMPAKYNSLSDIKGYIYFIAKDQHGCRFLQRKFDEGTPNDVQFIFNEIIDHVIELMINPFGNYLIQKLLDVCNEEQRMLILLVVTREPGELVKISLNTHGTRAVQKLIETVKTQQQILLVILALEPGFLDLIKDLNGNHVVQRCLQCLSIEDNKFIFDAAAKYCVEIACHRHGCCVLQRCIAHSTGKQREKLVAEISSNGLLLAQDAFGNYVVQYILDLNTPSATATLLSQFEGNYVHLSMQKFSSNVVEKCLKMLGEEIRSRIIRELLSSSQFEQLLQHPFANYVIQSALVVSKGPIHASLVEAARPHAAVLRTTPYCKRILSRTLLKK
ncbi:uncharacterized protein LOC143858089 [Tasmannia lanceolata]|uniref:uncharacterized protein LOC143858089 n=1 Tax=Tasmannia lanceolata TaxID=3420 RepID=UPI004063D7DA